MKGFIEFIRKQGVVGLAVGFILGGAISQFISALVNDIINPSVGIILGQTKGIEQASFSVGSATIAYGHFFGVLINFIIIAFIVYFGVNVLGLNKIDKKKDSDPPVIKETGKKAKKK